jgi:hypothetical protein
MFQFYAAGFAQATDPVEVAEVIRHAIETDHPQLRYQVSWGGRALIDGRAAISDDAWIALGAIEDDDAYYARFQKLFDLDITPH